MTPETRFGAMWSQSAASRGFPEFAQHIEDLGFHELWLAEDCFAHGGISLAAVALARTRNLTVGIGLLPAPVRSVALTAMELGTLADIFPHRLRVALGHGVDNWMRQIGARPKNRITYLRDATAAITDLLAGNQITYTGEFTLDRVMLDQAPASPPELLIGTTGPLGLAIARELGLGVLLPEGSGPESIRASRVDFPELAPFVSYCWLSLDQDEDAAQQTLLPVVRQWRAHNLYPRLYACASVPEAEVIDPQTLARVAVVGSARSCAEQIQHMHAAGARTLVMLPVGPDPTGTLERFQRDVVPLISAGPQTHTPKI